MMLCSASTPKIITPVNINRAEIDNIVEYNHNKTKVLLPKTYVIFTDFWLFSLGPLVLLLPKL